MCGIAGAFDMQSRRAFAPRALSSMTRALTHRGPDGEGAHDEAGLALATRRLAIVDVEHGAQPFTNEEADIEELDALMRRAVRRRLRADVPVGEGDWRARAG